MFNPNLKGYRLHQVAFKVSTGFTPDASTAILYPGSTIPERGVCHGCAIDAPYLKRIS